MNRDIAYIGHMLESIEHIKEYTKNGREYFLGDQKTQDAVIRNIIILGEAAKNISEECKGAFADIPWKKIAGMRNEVVHNYINVDPDVVWNVAESSVVTLERQLQKIQDSFSS